MRYLLDTDFLISSVLGRSHLPPSRLTHIGETGSAISIISLAELYEGPFHATNPPVAIADLHRDIAHLALLPLAPLVCLRFAETRALLRRQGKPRADLDLLIAATALAFDLTLVTLNVSDFQDIPSLRVVSGSAL